MFPIFKLCEAYQFLFMHLLFLFLKGSVVRYFPAYSLAQRLGITPHLLSRITGTVYLTQNGLEEGKSSNRVNIGLNLKYNKTNKEVFSSSSSNLNILIARYLLVLKFSSFCLCRNC